MFTVHNMIHVSWQMFVEHQNKSNKLSYFFQIHLGQLVPLPVYLLSSVARKVGTGLLVSIDRPPLHSVFHILGFHGFFPRLYQTWHARSRLALTCLGMCLCRSLKKSKLQWRRRCDVACWHSGKNRLGSRPFPSDGTTWATTSWRPGGEGCWGLLNLGFWLLEQLVPQKKPRHASRLPGSGIS